MNAVRLTVPTSVPANFWRLNISPKSKTIDSYWYEGEGVEGYFDSEGNNTDITFLRMPCEARVTSTFNRVRKHPVTGRLRPHWGVDLGAPRGTFRFTQPATE